MIRFNSLLGMFSLVAMWLWGIGVQAQPAVDAFQSTSSFMHSGTTLPMASSAGVTTTSEMEITGDNPFGDKTITGTDTPSEPGTPVGDGVWVLLVLALGYVGLTTLRRHRTGKIVSEEFRNF